MSTLPSGVGWGGGPWGGPAWGGLGLGPAALLLQQLLASAENALLATFNEPVYYSALLDTPDASQPELWAVTPVAGTVGYDGQPARPVTVVTVLPLVTAAQPPNSVFQLTLDRPMTPYPAQYALTISGIFSADLTQQVALGTTLSAPAVYRQLVPQQVEVPSPGRDFANPQTLAGAVASTIAQPYQAILGTFGNSDDGDYAIDSGDEGLKKRITRRLFTKKNGFVFLPGYGVGVTTYSKRLGKASTREQLAADCETQFSQEPEVAKVTVISRPDPTRPNLFRLGIFITKKSGQAVKYTTLLGMQ